MALASSDTIAPPAPTADAREALAALDGVRTRTFALIAHLSDDDLRRSHSPIMSPLAWDLAHIAAYEDLWLCTRHGGLPLLRPDLADVYDAFETPRAVRAEIELLGPVQARQYLSDVRAHTAAVIAEQGIGDGTLYELVLRHELQHTETMLQTLALAGLLPPEGALAAAGLQPPGPLEAEDAWIDVPAGPFAMGASEEGFAYDNERPRHEVEVPAFEIAREPVSNAEWTALTGQERDGDPRAPVCHVNWEQAQAFAQARGARLPKEAEWEKAAMLGLLGGVGRVWEWTSSRFDGYPGFEAHPYREYSEVFFPSRGRPSEPPSPSGDYRVLRGGSWATDGRVGTLTFRNWDLPVRSQIFAGVRLARDSGVGVEP